MDNQKKLSYSIRVTGKVQGVWYRKSTQLKAEALGVKGIVKNQADGSVYIEVLGTAAQVDALIAWCKEGPEDAEVKEVIPSVMAFKAFDDFQVIR